MPHPSHVYLTDLHAASRLLVSATHAVTAVVEAMHATMLEHPAPLSTARPTTTNGLPRLVYRNIHAITNLVGSLLDTVFEPLAVLQQPAPPTSARIKALAVLNGIIGDYLVDTGNALALPMQLCLHHQPLTLTRTDLATTLPEARSNLLVFVHGLCLSDFEWVRNGSDQSEQLANDLKANGLTLRYNTGQHISTNGQLFSQQLEALVTNWPVQVEQITIIGHSMGGLVTRSACHYAMQAGHTWLNQLHNLVFLGTPHHGAPLEQLGNWVHTLLARSPYTAIIDRIGQLRSAGITDLRYGNLLDEDWHGQDRFAHNHDLRQPVPLPDGVNAFTMAASTTPIGYGNLLPWWERPGKEGRRVLGDGLVPLHSALGFHLHPDRHLDFAATRQAILESLNHLDLLDHPATYTQLRTWLVSADNSFSSRGNV